MMPLNDLLHKPQAEAGSIGIVAVAAAQVFLEKLFCLIHQEAIAFISYPDYNLISLSVAINLNRQIWRRVFLGIIEQVKQSCCKIVFFSIDCTLSARYGKAKGTSQRKTEPDRFVAIPIVEVAFVGEDNVLDNGNRSIASLPKLAKRELFI